ncbi:MAG: hypothetical protein ACO1QB_00525 [Verrucomicrobiales bacterium]
MHLFLPAFVFMFLTLLGVGCAGKFSAAVDKHSLKTIAIDPTVKSLRPMEAAFKAVGSSGNATVTGEKWVDLIYIKRTRKIAELMRENQIDLADIVKAETVGFLANGHPLLAITNNAQATLVITIVQHGVASANFSLQETPYLTLKGEIVDAKGKVIWKGMADANPLKSKVRANVDDYYANPELLHSHWTKQARVAVQHLLE